MLAKASHPRRGGPGFRLSPSLGRMTPKHVATHGKQSSLALKQLIELLMKQPLRRRIWPTQR